MVKSPIFDGCAPNMGWKSPLSEVTGRRPLHGLRCRTEGDLWRQGARWRAAGGLGAGTGIEAPSIAELWEPGLGWILGGVWGGFWGDSTGGFKP